MLHLPVRVALATAALTLVGTVGCSREPAPRSAPEPGVADREAAGAVEAAPAEPSPSVPRGVVPYRGPLPPEDPPLRVAPGQRPLAPWVVDALGVLYERPSPEGPPAIALPVPRGIVVRGSGPMIRVLPGPMPYAEHLPQALRTALPEKGPYSNDVVQLPQGDVRLVAYDYTVNDTKLSRDSMEIDVAFTDEAGHRWRIVQAALAPLSPDPVNEPWFGGLAIDTVYHGETGNGIPAVPRVTCAMCSWGWADVWRDSTKVGSGVPMHVMVTSDTRAGPEANFAYKCYDCTANPIEEVHVVIPPQAFLPTPGGFLHVMWERAEVQSGAAAAIAAAAPTLGEPMETVVLRAVPYLQWSDTTLNLVAGRRYRLVLQNDDPSSDHALHLHVSGEGHQHGGETHEQGRMAEHRHGRGQPDRTRQTDSAGVSLPSADDLIAVPLPHGSLWATTVRFDEPGTYHFGCPVENHESRGMRGRVIVTAPGAGGEE